MQSDLDIHCPQKLLVSSTVGKERAAWNAEQDQHVNVQADLALQLLFRKKPHSHARQDKGGDINLCL